MAQFRLRRSRLRGSTNGRLRGNLGIADPVVGAGTAVPAITPNVRFTTWGNPAPRPRAVLPVGGVTVAPAVAILDVGVPKVVAADAPRIKATPADKGAPRTVTGVVSGTPRAVGSVTEKPDPVLGVTPSNEDEQVVASPDVPDQTVAAPDVPKKRALGRTKR